MNRNAALIAFVLLLAAAGCLLGSPPSQIAASDDTSTSAAMPASTSTSGATSTSGTSHPTSSSEPSSETSTSTGSSSGFVFIPPKDAQGPQSCSGFAQDCPPGEKCVPYIDEDSGGWYNDTRCVPLMENPAHVGEPCFVDGPWLSGIDNCEFGAMCWDVDEENMGVCVTMCTGSEETPICPKDYYCSDFSRGGAYAGICVPQCDPLAQDCDPSDVCIPNPNGMGFLCVLDASGREGQVHDTCLYANACDPGLWCADATAATECDPQAQGCCEPFCDLNAPNDCPGEDQVCVTIFDGDPPPGDEHIGFCSLP